MSLEEEVVLVDEANQVLGTSTRDEVHGPSTPLHRGFSLFLFNAKGELLLQQRSATKKTWPLVWSNSVCGHPMIDESNVDAAKRRLKYELGMEESGVEEVAPYRYTFVRDGIMENEICPILAGLTEQGPNPNPDEVAAVRWVKWQEFLDGIEKNPGQYSEWCEEEARILASHPWIESLILKAR